MEADNSVKHSLELLSKRWRIDPQISDLHLGKRNDVVDTALQVNRVIFHIPTLADDNLYYAAERNSIYIVELGMTWGQSWSALKKSWRNFYIARDKGDVEQIDMLMERITRIKKYMGLEDDKPPITREKPVGDIGKYLVHLELVRSQD
jgi:hypothetical protein